MFAPAEKDAFFGARHDHSTHLRMLEAESFDSVGELDIDPQVVAIEFQLISRPKATIFANVECKGRHVAIGRQFPVAVPRGVRLECNELVGHCLLLWLSRHGIILLLH